MALAPADKIRIIILFLLFLCKPLFSPRPGKPGRKRVVVEIRACAGCSGVFRGKWHPSPYLARFRASWALLRGLVVILEPPLLGMAMLARLARLVTALLLGVQPAAFPPALSFDVGHGLGKPLFPAKPLFAAFQGARRWMRAQAVELPPARRAAPLVNSLAVGQHDCRRGSRRSRGNPAGVPRRRRRPTP
ncbi:hypothetical protein AF485_25785 [Salmonella enterica subsp. enterica serovar Typhimurium]|nr:hypothetical protein [Salmonella enterica subsp. enterica serovar Typhimurium]